MAKAKKVENLSYEEAFEELGNIVADLENEVGNLDTTIELFERGQLLAKHCSALLNSAELKVQVLTDDGEIKDLE
jgi:exodeoxyribonuclease VII small subunit